VGTPLFASPEALAGGIVGSPHGVYGLGATLYTLFSGREPLLPRTQSIAQLRRVRQTGSPIPNGDLAPGLDRHFREILMHALSHDPRERGLTFRSLVRALENAQAIRPLAHRRGAGSPTSRGLFLAAGTALAAWGLWESLWHQRAAQGGSANTSRRD
jgi:serine/threonine protein kinase